MNGFETVPLVLVADDDKYERLLFQQMLEREGFRVEEASDGREAVDKAVQLRPDLILMDIQMPLLDGFEAVKLLRQEDRTTRIPIIVVTAAARNPTDVARGFGLGADDYLYKPFHRSELIARARSKIQAHWLEEKLQRRTEELEALIRIGAILNQALATDDLADRLLSVTLEQIPATHAALVVFDDEGKPMMQRYFGFTTNAPLQVGTLIHRVLSSQDAEFIEGETDALPNVFADVPDCRTGIAAPLKHHGKILGVLALGHRRVGRYSESDLRVLRSIGEQAALALRNTQLYTQLQAHALELESRVEARTQALQSAQVQLNRAEKMAALGNLAAGVAHEVNNPLQPILLNLDMALDDVDAARPVDRELLEYAKADVQRIQRLIVRLLDFARPAHTDMLSVNLNDVVQEVVQLIGKQFQHARVNLCLELHSTHHILGNADQLKQVLLNLSLNAMDAMPKGGELFISTTDRGQQVEVVVRDSGHGIPADQLPRIFDPFFTTKADGTGLGLSITYGIIEGHGGQIHVESEVGVFTRFTVLFPAINDE
jgi:two-component system, NtrC family, sensor kinase